MSRALQTAVVVAFLGSANASAQERPANPNDELNPPNPAELKAPTPAGYEEEPDDGNFEWLIVPNSETSTDRGIGGGVLGIFYWYDGSTRPFRDRLEVAFVTTTRLFQNHYVIWERLGLAGGRLRLRLKLGFQATRDRAFCGIGNQVTCSGDDAVDSAVADGFAVGTEEHDEIVASYYQVRLMRPLAEARLRWRAFPSRPDIEITGELQSTLQYSGFFGKKGPHPGSLYAKRFPGGEQEVLTIAEAGILLDRRNSEIHPSAGQLAGAFARLGVGASSDPRAYVGGSLQYARYDALGHGLVLANRGVADVLGGDVPIYEVGKVGGIYSSEAFGGGFGRGVRSNRFIGKIKLTSQTELRWRGPTIYRRARIMANVFADVGWIAESVRRVGGDPARVLVSAGLGPGLSWGRSFVARLDVGFSTYESYSPFFYLRVGHPF